jgi:hypothetical protein
VVIANLYAGRSASNPDVTPGLPVPAFSNKVLQGTVGGVYEGEIDNFDPLPGDNYCVVVDATQDGAVVGHWERPVQVVVNQ